MAFRRSRKPKNGARAAVAPAPTTTDDLLFGLIRQTQQLNERLSRLEERFEASVKASLSQADSNDVIELRLHSARLAAELSRVTVELRSEIDELARSRAHDRGQRSIERLAGPSDLARPPAAPPPPDVIDLSERRARQTTGWQPISDD